mgnify:CR=1 FL=1
MKFTKMHGLGNDYIFIRRQELAACGIPEGAFPRLARRLCDRHFGIGADGLVVLHPSESADIRMQMFNADGSEGLMCGNAARCVGTYLWHSGKFSDRPVIRMETGAGERTLHLLLQNDRLAGVTVDMGSVRDLRRITLHTDDTERQATVLSVGNPHCIIFHPDPDIVDVPGTGKVLEHAILPSHRVNIEWVRVNDPTHLQMRVYERGCGETLACGTGACAATAAAVERGLCPPDTRISVAMPGGILHVTVTKDKIFMEGDATLVFEGDIPLPLPCRKEETP